MKTIGFLNFGHWTDSPQSAVRSASDTLLQSIDLAVAAEELGADGAYFRVHHFARQLASPFPLLAAVGARTSRIEIGTGVIDMRYENPLYMAEDAGSADLISGGRLQLGISRGSPEQVIDGWRYFGYQPADGEDQADMARRHTEVFLQVLEGEGFAQPNPRPMFPNPPGLLRVEPHSEGLRERIWWGAASDDTARWAAAKGMHLMSSTLKKDETGEPFHVQQRKQIEVFREAWKEAGHAGEPRVSVSRSIMPITTDLDRMYFGREGASTDQFGQIEANLRAVFGRTYAAEPDVLSRSSPTTRRSRRPTPCCSPCPTSSASTTTPTCWRRCSPRWRRTSAGAEPHARTTATAPRTAVAASAVPTRSAPGRAARRAASPRPRARRPGR